MFGGRKTTFGSTAGRRPVNSEQRRQLQLWDELQQEASAPPRTAKGTLAAALAAEPATVSSQQASRPTSDTSDTSEDSDSDSDTVCSTGAAQESQRQPITVDDNKKEMPLPAETSANVVVQDPDASVDASVDAGEDQDSARDNHRDNHRDSARDNDRGNNQDSNHDGRQDDDGVAQVAAALQDLQIAIEEPAVVEAVDAPIASPLDRLLRLCGQTEPLSMPDVNFGGDLVEKIGEATYSDVYASWRMVDEARTQKHGLGSPSRQLMAVKVIPVGKTGDTDQLSLESVALEVSVTQAVRHIQQHMAPLDQAHNTETQHEPTTHANLVELERVMVCHGPYSPQLMVLWDEYDERKGSENIPPTDYDDEQLYVIMVLRHGGQDLEHTRLVSLLSRAQSVLLQVIMTLAQAEQQMRFEHRDLHWGNVLVEACDDEAWITYDIGVDGDGDGDGDRGRAHELRTVAVQTHGVRATIIDLTLSRMEQADGQLLYMDLEQDPELFVGKGQGQKGGDMQFDVYRQMREVVDKDWRRYEPRTNVLWLHYLAHKLVLCLASGSTTASTTASKTASKKSGGSTAKQRQMLQESRQCLRRVADQIRECASAADVARRVVQGDIRLSNITTSK
ncbi:hypothetical protein BC831DRAFT_480246 [Entophlyctis helioformis]|nr:hypothetical protein BC831DRAFT_480246 [Entophlyctis helioformis]